MKEPVKLSRLQKAALSSFFLIHSLVLLQSALPFAVLPRDPRAKTHWAWVSELQNSLVKAHQATENRAFQMYRYFWGLNQNWQTFAPSPPRRFASYKLAVTTAEGEQIIWSDPRSLERSGAGLFFDPIVKLVALFEQLDPVPRTLFAREMTRNFKKETGVEPTKTTLYADWVQIINRDGKILYHGPYRTPILTIDNP